MSIETHDRGRLRAIFARDPIAAVYQLGDLDEPFFSQSRWFAADDAVALIYNGLAVPVVLPFGDVAALLPDVPLPDRFYTKLAEAEVPLFDAYALEEPDELYVMGLDTLAPSAVSGLTLRVVTDPAPLVPLYEHYPGNYFHPSQVAAGVYVLAEMEGVAVAAGGTHAFSPAGEAAAIGNVVTATGWRDRGIAGALMSFLCAELQRRGCRHLGLHVNRGNLPAIACYRRLGFSIHGSITQYTAHRSRRAVGPPKSPARD